MIEPGLSQWTKASGRSVKLGQYKRAVLCALLPTHRLCTTGRSRSFTPLNRAMHLSWGSVNQMEWDWSRANAEHVVISNTLLMQATCWGPSAAMAAGWGRLRRQLSWPRDSGCPWSRKCCCRCLYSRIAAAASVSAANASCCCYERDQLLGLAARVGCQGWLRRSPHVLCCTERALSY